MPVFSISIALASLPFFLEPALPRSGRDLPLTRYELPLAGKPVGLTAFDVDGDGALEIVAATRSPGGVAAWGDLDAALAGDGTPRVLPLPDYLVGPLAIPAQGDTPARIAVASQENSKLYFLTAQDFAEGASAPSPALELPGVPRFLCAGPKGSIYVFTRTNQIIYVGTDGFGRVTYAEHDQVCAAMRLDGVSGDLDPGEMPMLIVGSQTDRVVAVYRADPEAKSGWKVLFDFEFEGIPRAFSTTDLDGDGDLELLIAGGDDVLWALGCGVSGGMNAWLEQDPLQPTRHRLTSVPIATQGSWALTLSGQAIASLEMAEKNTLQRDFQAYAGQSPVSFAEADFDGDGVQDIAAANIEARRVSVLLGAGPGALHAPLRAEAGRGPSELSVVRKGTGPQSLLVLSALDGRWSKLQRSPDGAITRSISAAAPPETVAFTAVHNASLESVGIATLSAGGPEGISLHFAPNLQAEAALTAASCVRIPCGTSAGAILATDFDGDGADEILATDPSSNRLRVFEVSVGEPSVRLLENLEVGPAPTALARGQASDFFVALSGSGAGIAHFSWNSSSKALAEIDRMDTAKGVPIDLCSPSPFVLCVLESRGRRDGAGALCVYEKIQGTWKTQYESSTGFRPYAIAASSDQIVVSAQNSHHLNYWTRAGSDWMRRPDLGCGTGPLDVALFDFDGDGLLDIAAANAFSDDVTVTVGR